MSIDSIEALAEEIDIQAFYATGIMSKLYLKGKRDGLLAALELLESGKTKLVEPEPDMPLGTACSIDGGPLHDDCDH